ncbi:MAG: hypothetical protein ABIB71_08585 [Candidatus Woesearchaeota archaeon]
MKIVLDTNFIVHAVKHKIDLMEEIAKITQFNAEVCLIDKSIEELEKLIKKGNLQDRSAAKLGLAIIKRKGLKTINTTENKDVDALLLQLDPKDSIIATHDKALEKELKEKGFRIIKIRQGKYLKVE